MAAAELKEQGNTAYKARRFDEAVAKYSEALAVARATAAETPDAEPTPAVLLLNRAAAHFEAGNAQLAIEDALAALAAQPEEHLRTLDGIAAHLEQQQQQPQEHDQAPATTTTLPATTTKALNRLARALLAAPSSETARKLLPALARLPAGVLETAHQAAAIFWTEVAALPPDHLPAPAEVSPVLATAFLGFEYYPTGHELRKSLLDAGSKRSASPRINLRKHILSPAASQGGPPPLRLCLAASSDPRHLLTTLIDAKSEAAYLEYAAGRTFQPKPFDMRRRQPKKPPHVLENNMIREKSVRYPKNATLTKDVHARLNERCAQPPQSIEILTNDIVPETVARTVLLMAALRMAGELEVHQEKALPRVAEAVHMPELTTPAASFAEVKKLIQHTPFFLWGAINLDPRFHRVYCGLLQTMEEVAAAGPETWAAHWALGSFRIRRPEVLALMALIWQRWRIEVPDINDVMDHARYFPGDVVETINRPDVSMSEAEAEAKLNSPELKLEIEQFAMALEEMQDMPPAVVAASLGLKLDTSQSMMDQRRAVGRAMIKRRMMGARPLKPEGSTMADLSYDQDHAHEWVRKNWPEHLAVRKKLRGLWICDVFEPLVKAGAAGKTAAAGKGERSSASPLAPQPGWDVRKPQHFHRCNTSLLSMQLSRGEDNGRDGVYGLSGYEQTPFNMIHDVAMELFVDPDSLPHECFWMDIGRLAAVALAEDTRLLQVDLTFECMDMVGLFQEQRRSTRPPFHVITLSNVPDYINWISILPLLDNRVCSSDAIVESQVLLFLPGYRCTEDYLWSTCRVTDAVLEVFGWKRFASSKDGLMVQLERIPTPVSQPPLSSREWRLFLDALTLRLLYGHYQGGEYAEYTGANLAAVAQVVASSPVPAHWSSGWVDAMLSGQLKTRAPPPLHRSEQPPPGGLADLQTQPERTWDVQPYVLEMSLLVRVFQLPVGASNAGARRALAAIQSDRVVEVGIPMLRMQPHGPHAQMQDLHMLLHTRPLRDGALERELWSPPLRHDPLHNYRVPIGGTIDLEAIMKQGPKAFDAAEAARVTPTSHRRKAQLMRAMHASGAGDGTVLHILTSLWHRQETYRGMPSSGTVRFLLPTRVLEQLCTRGGLRSPDNMPCGFVSTAGTTFSHVQLPDLPVTMDLRRPDDRSQPHPPLDNASRTGEAKRRFNAQILGSTLEAITAAYADRLDEVSQATGIVEVGRA